MNPFVQKRNEEARRQILQVLYEVGGGIRAKRVRRMLSDLGVCSLLWREYIDHLDHLVRADLVRIFPAGAREELSVVQQAEFMDFFRRMQIDDAECETVVVRIREKGRNFIEGTETSVKGVANE